MVKVNKRRQWASLVYASWNSKSVQTSHKFFSRKIKCADRKAHSVSQNCADAVPTKENDLFCCFRGFLILGRILGVIPISGVFKNSYKDLYFSPCSIAVGTSSCCILLLLLNTFLVIRNNMWDQSGGALQIAGVLVRPVFALWGFFMYVYFLARGKEFLKIFKFWFGTSSSIYYSKNDTYLYRFVVTVSTVLFTSAVLENVLLNMKFFMVFDDINGHTIKYGKETSNVSWFQLYHRRANNQWNSVMGDHPVFVAIAFLVHKWTLYSWNYLDVLMALICRALYYKFEVLCSTAEQTLFLPVSLESPGSRISSEIGHQQWAWKKLADDHERLCDLIDVINEFFSPLIFLSYAINVYLVCMMLLGALNPNFVAQSLVHSIYAPWSFLHLILRIFLLTICAAKVHDYAHSIRKVVQRCPVELHDGNIAKLEKRVSACEKIGLTGWGFFVVTKPFMLGILNVVFTIEIVLLQGLPTTLPASSNTP